MDYNSLPDLITYYIIKYICSANNEQKDFKHRLPLLAINRKHRQLASPLVFDSLFMDFSYSRTIDPKTSTTFWKPFQSGNYELYLTPTKHQDFVRHFELGHKDSHGKLSDALKMMAAMLDIPIPEMEMETEDELVKNAPWMVEQFIGMFPNIRRCHLNTTGYSNNICHQFVSKWMDLLGSQLVEFHTNIPIGKTIQGLSMELTKLSFSCNETQNVLLPRVNIQILEYLCIYDPPKDFDWQCFQSSNSVLRFPNLHTLKIHSFDFSVDQPGTTRKPTKIQLPKLKTLDVVIANGGTATFILEQLPDHLDRLRLHENQWVFQDFAQLPIKSVGRLDVVINNYNQNLDDRFYQYSNRLFGQILCKESVVRFGELAIDGLELDRTHWSNLTNLDLDVRELRVCLYILVKLPGLRKFLLACRSPYEDEDNTDVENIPQTPVKQLCNHGLEELIFSNYNLDGWPREYVVGVGVCLAKSLTGLQRIYVDIGKDEDMNDGMNKAFNEYPYLRAVEVIAIPIHKHVWWRFDE